MTVLLYETVNDYAIIDPGPGTLLVAHPAMDDPNFARSVVLLLAHDDGEGTMGVIINRPIDATGLESTVIAPWLESAPDPGTVFSGGPVQPDGFVCLVEDDTEPALVQSIDFMAQDPDPFRRHRMFRGYAGWAPGQLADETAAGGWIVVPARSDDAFTTHPDTLWSRALERQGGSIAALARVPADPSLN